MTLLLAASAVFVFIAVAVAIVPPALAAGARRADIGPPA